MEEITSEHSLNVRSSFLIFLCIFLFLSIIKFLCSNCSFSFGNYLQQLMGAEDCQTGQEECLKRRMIAEAHLDYIYTQHHKP